VEKFEVGTSRIRRKSAKYIRVIKSRTDGTFSIHGGYKNVHKTVTTEKT
jgi:hypothetical protein